MPRPHEIAADARALYGPLAVRPSAQEAGDGALWVDPSAQQPLTQVQSGNWVSLAPAGVPVLRGPYVVDYTAIPHDGDTLVLWTPQVGDLLLMLTSPAAGRIAGATAGGPFSAAGLNIGTADAPDSIAADIQFSDRGGEAGFSGLPYIFSSTSPVQVSYLASGEGAMTAGHGAFYALVARAVAP